MKWLGIWWEIINKAKFDVKSAGGFVAEEKSVGGRILYQSAGGFAHNLKSLFQDFADIISLLENFHWSSSKLNNISFRLVFEIVF